MPRTSSPKSEGYQTLMKFATTEKDFVDMAKKYPRDVVRIATEAFQQIRAPPSLFVKHAGLNPDAQCFTIDKNNTPLDVALYTAEPEEARELLRLGARKLTKYALEFLLQGRGSYYTWDEPDEQAKRAESIKKILKILKEYGIDMNRYEASAFSEDFKNHVFEYAHFNHPYLTIPLDVIDEINETIEENREEGLIGGAGSKFMLQGKTYKVNKTPSGARYIVVGKGKGKRTLFFK